MQSSKTNREFDSVRVVLHRKIYSNSVTLSLHIGTKNKLKHIFHKIKIMVINSLDGLIYVQN